MEIEPAQGYCTGFIVKARVGKVLAAVVLPIVPEYPLDVLEVVAPICLRKEFKLRDGCELAVTFVV
jgi:CTP-dependent riboflavin kinase